MPVLPLQFQLIAIVVLLLTTNTYSYYKGKDIVTKEYNEFRVAVESESVKIKLENEALRVAQKQQINQLTKEHTDAINRLSSSYKSRLSGLQRKSISCDGEVPSDSSTSSSVNDAAPNTRFDSRELEATYAKLEADCSVTTLNLLYLQDYASNLQFYPKP